jgi:hypothetical protein
VSVTSGHKTGKSAAAAIAAFWWILTHPGGRVILTAPTKWQVRGVIFKEIRSLYDNARFPIGGDLSLDPDIGLQFKDGREIVGRTTNDADRFSGISGDILIIADEASGIPEDIFEAIEGVLAGGGSFLMISNPTRTSGTFHASHTTARDEWHTIRISSEESPNVTQGKQLVKGLATRGWIEKRRKIWGIGSPIYDVRVEGKFSSDASNAAVPQHLIATSANGWDPEEEPSAEALRIGVHVARFGDEDSVIFPIRGKRAEPLEAISGANPAKITPRVIDMVEKLRRRGESVSVVVDTLGAGAQVIASLRAARDLGIDVLEFDPRADARDSRRYGSAQAEALFSVADWMTAGGTFPGDPELEEDLAGLVYLYDGSGRRIISSEIAAKRDIGRAPSRAYAFALAMSEGASSECAEYGDYSAFYEQVKTRF